MRPEDQALLCAKASEAIYGISADPTPWITAKAVMEAEGFSNFLWIDLPTFYEDVFCFIASSETYHILVFRGTKAPQDWITDLACTTVRFEAMFAGGPAIGSIHEGFGRCLFDSLPRIAFPLGHRDRYKPLLITGHSLGGALAALAGACFSVLNYSVPPVSAVYTFGQPRIGLHDFCDEYGRRMGRKLIRFVNKMDVVPRVPFQGVDYGDVGTLIHFDSSGTPALQSLEWTNFLNRGLHGICDLTEILTHLKADIGDHSVTGYRNIVELQRSALALFF
jgi:hypothetical protein